MDALHVIKIGGNVIDDEQALQQFLVSFSSIKNKSILIHGGGRLATDLAEKSGIKQQLKDGRRITDAETLKIVTMVYAGLINKNIVAQLQAHGMNAIGITGADANAILAHKRTGSETDYGFAGDIDEVNTRQFTQWLEAGLVPVVAPITHDKKGQLLNTNADTLATAIAVALSKSFSVQLVFCFEKPGVLADSNDLSSVISSLDKDAFHKLKSEKKIHSGMIPKLDNAFNAVNAGVKSITIGNAEELEKLLNNKSGTLIHA